MHPYSLHIIFRQRRSQNIGYEEVSHKLTVSPRLVHWIFLSVAECIYHEPNRTMPAVVKKSDQRGLVAWPVTTQFSPHFGRNCPPQHRTPPPPASANGSSSSCLITSDSPDYNLFHNQVLGRTLEPVTPGSIFVQSRYVFARILWCLKVDWIWMFYSQIFTNVTSNWLSDQGNMPKPWVFWVIFKFLNFYQLRSGMVMQKCKSQTFP